MTGKSGDSHTSSSDSTYAVEYAQVYGERWTWGFSLGRGDLLIPYPNWNLQYDFLRKENWKIGFGAMYGGYWDPRARYGAGLVGSYTITANFLLFAKEEWISDMVKYEAANGTTFDNSVDVNLKYLLHMIGAEFILPKDEKGKAPASFLMSLGRQDLQSYKVTYEEYPSNFQYDDGAWGRVEVRFYLD